MKSLLLRVAASLFALTCLAPAFAQNTMVRLHTSQGVMDFRLLNAEAPITVTNFLNYVRAGRYTDSLVHRSAWINQTTPFVIQGGGFKWPAGTDTTISAIDTYPAIPDEYSATRPNVRGTVAMARSATNAGVVPNSATSQWYINMINNPSLDTQQFTVFARVTTPGMAVADKISNLPRYSINSTFSELPAYNVSGNTIYRENLVIVSEAREMPNTTDADRIFNYAEALLPQYLSPQKATTMEYAGYQFRYYSGTNVYVGTKDGGVWYLVPAVSSQPVLYDTVANMLAAAQAAGY